MPDISANLIKLRQQIADLEQKYGRPSGSVTLLAVSKTRSVEEVRTALDSGQVDFGENYWQDARHKIESVHHKSLCWHFIGPVQSNKTRVIAENFSWVHSVDRIRIAQRLNQARSSHVQPINVCIQVNISGESSKSGIPPDELESFAERVSHEKNLRLRGLMTMPGLVDDLEQQRIPFRKLKECMKSLSDRFGTLDTLSMGTTSDMEAAIAEGATIVRIGTALFGNR